MWIRKGFSFKLTPDGAQARKMSRFAGCTRFVYNKGIAWNEEQRNADSNFKISYKALSAQLPIWKEWDEGTKNGPDRSALLGHNFVYQETKPYGFYSSYFHQRISS